MIKIFKYIIILIIVAAGAAAAWHFLARTKKSDITIETGRIADVKSMARLCTMEIYNEVPILDTINDKVIFAIQKQEGSISFDLDNIRIDEAGDTIFVILPEEIIELRESTEKNSWEVIDTRHIGILGKIRNDRISLEEENAVKAKARRKAVRDLYLNGTVGHARAEAVKNLEMMMEAAFHRPVVVSDPSQQ